MAWAVTSLKIVRQWCSRGYNTQCLLTVLMALVLMNLVLVLTTCLLSRNELRLSGRRVGELSQFSQELEAENLEAQMYATILVNEVSWSRSTGRTETEDLTCVSVHEGQLSGGGGQLYVV